MAENVRGAHFDESLSRLVAAVAQVAGNDRAECSVYHRDTTGRVSVVLSGLVNPEVVERIIEVAKAEVGGYLRDDYPVRTESDIGALRILNEGLTAPVVRVDEFKVRFIDRRVAGADWLVASGDRASGIPRVTFASIKGGVGRSTALAVVAAHLSRSGKRVIAIDLDLEAPGIGTMLVVAGATSDFGALDYLVDSGVQNPSLLRASDYIAGSFLGETGAAVSIMPAIGTSTLKSPENAIAKLSRVYIEASEEGDGKLYHERVRDLLDRLAESGQYDVILIDARAGLHESTAAAIQSSGGDVLLFGSDQPQTFLGFTLLLSHMSTYLGATYEKLKERLVFIHAKASADSEVSARVSAAFKNIVSNSGGTVAAASEISTLDADDFDMDWGDADVSDLITLRETEVIRVFDDARFAGFDPLAQSRVLAPELYSATFGELLSWFDDLLEIEGLDQE